VVLIPYEELQPETLAALIEEFVSREGAIHGHRDDSLEAKTEAVMSQLRRGVAVIVFDEEDETCTIVTKDSLRKRQE
jgi:uncharacterized protein YheU (UPF0270 family)